MSPSSLTVIWVKAFVPEHDFAFSKRFHGASSFMPDNPGDVSQRIARNIPRRA